MGPSWLDDGLTLDCLVPVSQLIRSPVFWCTSDALDDLVHVGIHSGRVEVGVVGFWFLAEPLPRPCCFWTLRGLWQTWTSLACQAGGAELEGLLLVKDGCSSRACGQNCNCGCQSSADHGIYLSFAISKILITKLCPIYQQHKTIFYAAVAVWK